MLILWVVLKAGRFCAVSVSCGVCGGGTAVGSGTVYCGADAYSKRDRGGRGRSFLLYYFSGIPLFCGQLSGASDLRYGNGNLSVFFSDTIVPVMQRFYQWLDRFVSVFYPTELTGKTSGLHGVGEESAQTLKNAGKLMSGISDGVIDGVSGMAAGIPGFFMKLLIAVIATVFMELEFPEIKAFLKRQIPAEYQRAFRDGKKLCDRDDGKMYPLVLPDLWYYICGTYGRLVSAWHQKCICHRVYHCGT